MGQENSLPNGDRDDGGRCPDCGHAPHLPRICMVEEGEQHGLANWQVVCGCWYTCPSCGSDEHLEPIGCACGNPCHKRGHHNCPYGPP